MRNYLVILIVLLLVLSSCSPAVGPAPVSQESIHDFMQAYRDAWKAGDAEKVLRHISPDIIMFPAGKTTQPVIGKTALSDFWFPPSDISYPILQYEIEHEEIGGDGSVAYYQGLSYLTWCTLENGIGRDTLTSISEFTNILRKEQGEWKIYRIMFNSKEEGYTR